MTIRVIRHITMSRSYNNVAFILLVEVAVRGLRS